MLIYTYNFEKFIKKKIISKILIVPNKYILKGSFSRKAPYVTDIDILSRIYPKVNPSNIYQNLVNLINSLGNNNEIIFIRVICGFDKRFRLDEITDDTISQIKPLLTKDELDLLDIILIKYVNDNTQKLFYVNELIRPYYRLKWTPDDIVNNTQKVLPGGLVVTFKQVVESNKNLIMRFVAKLKIYPIGIDNAVLYDDINILQIYMESSNYRTQLSNYNREYYYMLAQLRYYFFGNPKILSEIEDIIERTFGLHKQIMERIDVYQLMLGSGHLDIHSATQIVTSIITDIVYLENFTSNIPKLLSEIGTNNDPDTKIQEWDKLLKDLYDEIFVFINTESKSCFYKYLNLMPDDQKSKFYIVSKTIDSDSNPTN